jgi:hypothetical protein
VANRPRKPRTSPYNRRAGAIEPRRALTNEAEPESDRPGRRSVVSSPLARREPQEWRPLSWQLSRSELRQLAAAIRHRWPIPHDRLERLVDTAARIACDPGASDRHSIAAAMVLLAIERRGGQEPADTSQDAHESRGP